MEGVLAKGSSLVGCRVAVREYEDAHSVLTERLECLNLEKATLEEAIRRLDIERSDVIDGIARGSKKDSDLSKVRKSLDLNRGNLLDTTEIIGCTKTALEQAARDLLQARSILKREEARAWRNVVKEVSARYSPQVQEIFLKMYVAVVSSSPDGGAPLFHSISNAFDLRVPRFDLPVGQEEFHFVKAELAKEFGVV